MLNFNTVFQSCGMGEEPPPCQGWRPSTQFYHNINLRGEISLYTVFVLVLASFSSAVSAATIQDGKSPRSQGQRPECVPDTPRGPCKRSNLSCYPDVTWHDSEHVQVDWGTIFENCDESHVEAVNIKIQGEQERTESVTFGQKQPILQVTPCSQQFFRIEIKFTDYYKEKYHDSSKISGKTNFNENGECGKGSGSNPVSSFFCILLGLAVGGRFRVM